jgi:hypothetical protein
MKPTFHRPAYACDLRETAWQVVVPIAGRLAPLVWPARFPNRSAAETWLQSEPGRSVVARIQADRRLPEDVLP